MTKSFIGKVGRAVLIIFSLLLVCILILMGVLFAWSPGKSKPFLDENGMELVSSISEKIYTNINGVEQGMFIMGKDITNPVLLFLHGGPGMPEYFINEIYPSGFENYFTVCWWEQRGAGLSYNSDIPAESITVEQLISDTLELTNYLRQRFGQEKIYLMGHSWGTFLGIHAAAQAPELYHAYIGISQMVEQLESEKIAYQYMLEQYKAMNDTIMIQKLIGYPVLESDDAMSAYLSSMLRDEAMHKLGIGTTRKIDSVITGIFVPVMECRAYTLSEKINIWRGKSFTGGTTGLRDELYATNLRITVPELDIPAYFFSGFHDYTVYYGLSKEYLEMLNAPIKGFYTFEDSAHSPLFEEPEKFLKIMRGDVLNATLSLAD